MKIEIEDVSIMYPNEDSGVNRKVVFRDDAEFLQVDFVDKELSIGGFALNKEQVQVFRDILNMVIKNKLLDG